MKRPFTPSIFITDGREEEGVLTVLRVARVCARSLVRSMIAEGMRAANGWYSFDNRVMRDYNAPDFAK